MEEGKLMKVLDLFAGLKGWSQPFANRGHEVKTLDYLEKFNCDYTVDILKWDWNELPWVPDIICASPPCEKFSTMGFQYGWFDQFYNKEEKRWLTKPMTPEAEHAMSLVNRAVQIIDHFKPRWFVIENPRALLRQVDIIPYPRQTVWYCHYGEQRAKPTDLWGQFPESLTLSPPCHNRRNHPEGCCCYDHNAAPRGSRTGTQGMDRFESAKIPYPLALAFCEAAENGT